MGADGLEPSTSVLSGLRSNQLSYAPGSHIIHKESRIKKLRPGLDPALILAKRPAAAGYKIHSYLALTEIFLGFASSALGKVIVNTPFSSSAFALSVLTGQGMVVV